MIKVVVAEVGGSCVEVELNEGARVAEAIARAGLGNMSSKEIRVNSGKASMETSLRNGDFVQLIPNVEGARV